MSLPVPDRPTPNVPAHLRGVPTPGDQSAADVITIRPAPRREPPFDDEIAARHLHVVGPLDQRLPFAQPSTASARPFRTPRTANRAELPDPTAFARRLVVAILETVAGRRSLSQLAPHLSVGVHSGLHKDAEGAGGTKRAWARTAQLRTVRVCEPVDGVAEVAAVVQCGPRVRAIAVRLEGLDGRWRCTRLQIG